MTALAPPLTDRFKLGVLIMLFPIVMGAPWVGGYFGSLEFGLDTTGNLTDGPTGIPRAFPGCEGFGCETIGGRGGSVCIVTNTNSTGTGSFTDCIMQTSPRIIIFRVSGVITVGTSGNEINPALAQSNVTVLGQTAPGDGIMLKPFSTGRIIRLGQFDVQSNAFSHGIFQHIRMRLVPGSGGSTPNSGNDTFLISAGSHHIVFDHCETIWTSDESFNLVGSNIHDITFSRMIIGEAGLAQNEGPLMTGNPGGYHYNITLHHNLILHQEHRGPLWAASTAPLTTDPRGLEFINNVSYNNFAQGFRAQTGSPFQGYNEPMKWDILGNYTKNGPNGGASPVTTLKAGDGAPAGAWAEAWNFKWEGGTWRNQDGTPHVLNNETNNYAMVNVILNGGYAAEPIIVRTTRITLPEFPVTVQSFQDAYNSVVINEDVGAKPFDSHAQRLVDAPENGDAYNQSLIPAPFGSGSVAFVTFSVPTDTDNDGVPDSYETLIGTDPNVFENQAVLDSDSDGYVNIEDWAHSLTDYPTP